jgi:hypothetical protein
MRIAMALGMLAVTGLVSGCGSRQEASLPRGPLLTGKLEGGYFWKNPLSAPNNEGGGYENGSRAEVYENFIVVTTSDGLSHVHPHGYYSGLAIKKE